MARCVDSEGAVVAVVGIHQEAAVCPSFAAAAVVVVAAAAVAIHLVSHNLSLAGALVAEEELQPAAAPAHVGEGVVAVVEAESWDAGPGEGLGCIVVGHPC